ncbi:hypothetical protein M1247_12095 [Mycobacterium sp. 21AC1]|uniref:hypothetical protein n=1 Tax=[Mycobacterium] appelbergii TaxID=2939269 RepID=UPI0029390D66|nr:hypothetical protein [Mycobacterium sp. 21AC1]MDV3125658.1 hypothetical protein [Mycobacterium sp. 21AC1]
MKAIRIFSMVALGLPTLASIAWAIVTLVHGEYLTTLVALGSGAFWFLGLLTWILLPTAVAWGISDATGTTIRIDKRIEAVVLLGVATGTVALGLLAGFGAAGKLAIPLPPDISRMYALVFAGPAVVCLLLVVVTLRRPGISRIRLTPTGFEFAEVFSTKAGAWSEVTDVTSVVPDDTAARSPLVMAMANDKARIVKDSALFTPDGRALLEFVRFYWQHPENRGELADGLALQRLQTVQGEVKPGTSS